MAKKTKKTKTPSAPNPADALDNPSLLPQISLDPEGEANDPPPRT